MNMLDHQLKMGVTTPARAFQWLFAALSFVATCTARADCQRDWDTSLSPPGSFSVVVASLTLPNDEVLVGGSFSHSGTTPIRNLAKWSQGGWSAFGDPDDVVNALLRLPNGHIVVAGKFRRIGGIAAEFIARFDGSTWHPMGSGGFASGIDHLAYHPSGDIIAAETTFLFQSPIGPLSGLGRWNGVTWSRVLPATMMPSYGVYNGIAIEPNGAILIFGSFQITSSRLARVNNGVVSSLQPPFSDRGVSAVSVAPNGSITVASNGALGRAETNISTLVGTTWISEYTAPMSPWVLHRLAGGDLLVGGAPFDSQYSGLARRTNGTWTQMGQPFGQRPIFAIRSLNELSDGEVVVGGAFCNISDQYFTSVARASAQSWHPLGTGIQGLELRAVAPGPNGGIVVAGRTYISPSASFAVSMYAPSLSSGGWSALGPVAPYQTYIEALVRSPSGELACAGSFVNGSGSLEIGRLQGLVWTPLANFPNSSIITTLAFSPAGQLWTANSAGLTRTDPSGLVTIPGSPAVSAILALEDGHVVVGSARTLPAPSPIAGTFLSVWNGSVWSTLGSGITGGAVNALVRDRTGGIIAAGSFTTAGSQPARGIARWDGSAWLPLGSGIDGIVNALAVLPDGSIVAGGSFGSAGGTVARNIARWDGSTWSAMNVGTNNVVYGLSVLDDGSLAVVGSFSTVGGNLFAGAIARWAVQRPCRADFDCSGTLSLEDITEYLAAWFDQSLDTNIDGDAKVEVEDLLGFLNNWFTGC